jgi:membrane fusion protein
MTSLFRPEAIEGQRQAWLGGIQLVRPIGLTVLTAAAVLTAVAVGSYLTWGEYTRKARVAGFLVPDKGLIRLMAPEGGTLVERRATEGQLVQKDDVLFVLSVDRSTLTGDAQSRVRSSLAERGRSLQESLAQREALLAQQLTALDRRIADMQRELDQIEAEGSLHDKRLVLAREQQTRLESLRAENFISSAQVQAKSEDVLGLQAARQTVERQHAALRRELGTLEAERRELPLRTRVAQGEVARELAALAQQGAESEARQQVIVKAPQAGVLSAVLAEPGQYVDPQRALASLVPTSAQLEAHLYAPSSAVGFLRPEQAVQLRYEAYPYQKFGHQAGHVVQVSHTPLQASELASLPLAGVSTGAATVAGEPLYRVTVALDRQTVNAYGQPQMLSTGMQVDADVLLERRRLIEWIFEPVLGLAGRV